MNQRVYSNYDLISVKNGRNDSFNVLGNINSVESTCSYLPTLERSFLNIKKLTFGVDSPVVWKLLWDDLEIRIRIEKNLKSFSDGFCINNANNGNNDNNNNQEKRANQEFKWCIFLQRMFSKEATKVKFIWIESTFLSYFFIIVKKEL